MPWDFGSSGRNFRSGKISERRLTVTQSGSTLGGGCRYGGRYPAAGQCPDTVQINDVICKFGTNIARVRTRRREPDRALVSICLGGHFQEVVQLIAQTTALPRDRQSNWDGGERNTLTVSSDARNAEINAAQLAVKLRFQGLELNDSATAPECLPPGVPIQLDRLVLRAKLRDSTSSQPIGAWCPPGLFLMLNRSELAATHSAQSCLIISSLHPDRNGRELRSRFRVGLGACFQSDDRHNVAQKTHRLAYA
jgi:hypothetical protein